MPVLLDTTAMAPHERVRAITQLMDAEQMPMRFEMPHPAGEMRSWTASWNLGTLQVLQTCGSAIRGTRQDREIEATPDPYVSIAYFARGTSAGFRVKEDVLRRPGEIFVYDLTEPYGLLYPDDHDVIGLQIRYEDLGLPVEIVHRGVSRAEGSPLYELVRRHTARVHGALAVVDGTPVGRVLADVTVDLVRAMLISAAGEPDSLDVLEQTFAIRVEQFVREHLGESRLSPREIAGAHHVSVRQLYYLWSASHSESLVEWTMSRRLESAARLLLRGDEPITAIASRCGFVDPGHFSRRFRDRYGVPPGEWRLLHRSLDRLPTRPRPTEDPEAEV